MHAHRKQSFQSDKKRISFASLYLRPSFEFNWQCMLITYMRILARGEKETARCHVVAKMQESNITHNSYVVVIC